MTRAPAPAPRTHRLAGAPPAKPSLLVSAPGVLHSAGRLPAVTCVVARHSTPPAVPGRPAVFIRGFGGQKSRSLPLVTMNRAPVTGHLQVPAGTGAVTALGQEPRKERLGDAGLSFPRAVALVTSAEKSLRLVSLLISCRIEN